MIEANTSEVQADGAATVEFTAESFSVYGVVYTVDFYWEVNGKTYDFSLPGGGFVSLKRLMESLNVAGNDAEAGEAVEEFAADIRKVEFSAPDLVWIGKVDEDSTVGSLKEVNGLECEYSADLTEEQIAEINEQTVEAGDWALISLQPFATEETLSVTMNNGEKFVVRVTDAAVENGANTKIPRDDGQMNVNNREEGILLKLFDYSGYANNNQNQWSDIDSINGNNTSYGNLRNGWGVNSDRTLLFSGSGLGGSEWYNNFTGTRPSGMEYYSGKRADGIVKGELVNGYPMLSDSITKATGDDGSLSYLFHEGEQDGVTEYSADGKGLQGLLRKDSDGYYYYSSEDNYARFDEDDDYIDLYTDTYYKNNGKKAAQNNGYGSMGFFPFTDYNSGITEEKGPNRMYYDHQLGMSLQAYFTYPPYGRMGGEEDGLPTTFEFSGDDDVWVYVDGKLAMDLGGVHQPIKGVIDFAAKEVRIYEYEGYNSTNSPKTETVTTIPFSDMFGENGFDDTPYSTHKIDFFFLERGGCDSNCALSFNLEALTTAVKEFTKVDGENAPLPGATFTIYTDEQCTKPLSVVNNALTATSDEEGKVSFAAIPVRKNPDGTPLVYYMKETGTPDGYRTNRNTYKLVFNETTKTYDVLTLDDESSEQITNTPLAPIQLGVKKQWQDAAGNPIVPEQNYRAVFKVHRLKSYTTPDEVVTGSDNTLRIRHVANDSSWNTSGEVTYKYLRGRTVTINYDYHGTTSNGNKRQYRYSTNGGSSWSYSGNLGDKGSFDITIPNSGQYLIEFYDSNNAVTWDIDAHAQKGETLVDQPDEFTCEDIELEGNQTTGTFNSGLTEYSGKFPVREEINGVTYTYKYYITEESRFPSNSEKIYVDSSGKIISDTSKAGTDDNYVQTVINRELMDLPIEKFWEFANDDAADAWTATFQLQSRLVDKETGQAISTYTDINGRQVEVSSADSGKGFFNELPIYAVQDGIEYRVQYSVKEIAYRAWRTSDDTTVLQWQDPGYYANPVQQIGKKYSLHYVQDAGENGATLSDYTLIDINTPENRVETKQIGISIEKTWPDGVDLSGAHADFVLKRGVYEEYRNFPAGTTEWVTVTLVTGSVTQTMEVAKNWDMTIFGNIKAYTDAERIELSDGSEPSGIEVFSYDNSSENEEHTFYIQFKADRDMTVSLVDGAQYVVGGENGFRLTDINDPADMTISEDRTFELPFSLSDENDWSAAFRKLPVIEEDTQYNVDHPLEITRYVYRYYIEETGCSPEGYSPTFKDSSGNLLGDLNNRIDNGGKITAENHLKPGSLKITKVVKVNNDTPSDLESALVDGSYEFTIAGVAGTPTEHEPIRTVLVEISGGQANTVEVEGLVPGQYTVTEKTPVNGTSLISSNNLTVTVESDKVGNLVPDGAKASFTNNINTTTVSFGKDWKKEDKVTALAGKEDFPVTYTLMQIAENASGVPVHNDIYEGTYFLNGQARTATAERPCIFYVSQNVPVTITDLPEEGVVNGEAVTFKYYAVENEIEGFVPDAPPAVAQGTYTITNSAAPETSRTTDVTVEKKWSGNNAESIGGVKFKLIQEKAEVPERSFYPFVIRLRDQDGVIRQDDVVLYVKHNTSLDIPVLSTGSLEGSKVWLEAVSKSNEESFQVTSIVSPRSIVLRISGLSGDDYKWGEDWNLGTITVYNDRGEMSDTPATFIDELNSDDSTKLEYSDSTVEYIVNMPEKGVSETIGLSTTDYAGEWKTTLNNLPYYDRGEDGKYYAYRYRVAEVSIIDPETKEEIETITQNADGTGGESTHFTVVYNNSPGGTASAPLEITNTRKTETEITLKKVSKENVNKENLSDEDLLDGAKFKIEKYSSLDPVTKDKDWNDVYSVENTGSNGTFTFSGLSEGIYKIEETKYPYGYVKIAESPTFRVNDDLSITLLDAQGNAVPNNQTAMIRVVENTTTIIVGNELGAALPNAGGSGTGLLYFLGILLTCLAGVGLVMRKRIKIS